MACSEKLFFSADLKLRYAVQEEYLDNDGWVTVMFC